MKMLSQGEYWTKEAQKFDAIYSHKKNKLSVLLDKVFRKAMYQRFNYTMEQSEPIAGKTFLDVGCGTGLFSLELARKGGKKVTGIDVAPRMVEICKSRAKAEGVVDNTCFILSDIMDFDTNEQFDITIGMGLLDYIKNPQPELTRMRGLTTDKAMLSFPILWSWRTVPRKIRLGLKKCPVYFYTRRRIGKLLRQAGFGEIEIKQMGPMYFVTAFCR
jgi:2-polyprenyl-3-methyl-5-hydroxy-6-metoxy-1,4-benzoquinol methylase